jgi:ATP-binding cassette subfamily B protein
MSMGPGAGGPPWRFLRSDRSVIDNKIERRTVRRVLGFARPHRRLIAGFLAVTVVDAALVVAPPLLLKAIIDDGVRTGDVSLVVWLAALVAVVAVVDAGFGLVTGWLSSRIGEGLIYDLRTQVFAHVQRQSLAFFTRTQTGALVSRLNNDVIGAQRAFTSTLQGTVSNIIAAVVVGVTMLFLSWPVTLLCLALFPILLVASRVVGNKLADLSRQQMDGNADLGNAMTERFNVGGAMLLKLFGRREAEDVAYARKAAVVRDLGVRISLLTRIFFAAMTLVPQLATALVYGIGGWLAIRGDLSVGTIVALGVLLTRLLGPLQGLSNVRIDVMTALVSFDRVFELLDLPSLIREKPDAVALPASASRLEFDHVAFTYPRAEEISLASLETIARTESRDTGRVLHDVTFTAEPGQMVALVGPSGAGKTTVTHLVARLYDVESGAVRVGGHDVRDVTLQSLEDVVGYVTQDAHMFHDTIRANLLYARPDALEAAQIASLVRALPDGLDTVVGDRGYRLSGGERQRLAIARLLLKAPAVVVLDEATAHLDSESEAAVQQALDAALEGRTSLVIAHRLSTVRNADLILVLDDGRVVQQGTHAELLAAGGLYATLHATQFREGRTESTVAG